MKLKQRLLFSIAGKVEEAIEFIRQNEPPEGYFLAFSGGKDSVVIYDLARKAGVKFEAYYSATQVDPPELAHFIHKHYPDVKWLFPKKSFFKCILTRGFPTMISRWCCDFLKKDPTKKIPLKHRLVGIRAEESWRRRKRKDNPEFFKAWGYWIYKPIFNWLKWEVWEYIEVNKLPYCKLYDEGFNRLGCVVCPFLSYKQHQIHRQRWPKHYEAFEKAMKALWEKRDKKRIQEKGYNWSFEEYLERWYRNM